jgi:hypothetical protein
LSSTRFSPIYLIGATLKLCFTERRQAGVIETRYVRFFVFAFGPPYAKETEQADANKSEHVRLGNSGG